LCSAQNVTDYETLIRSAVPYEPPNAEIDSDQSNDDDNDYHIDNDSHDHDAPVVEQDEEDKIEL